MRQQKVSELSLSEKIFIYSISVVFAMSSITLLYFHLLFPGRSYSFTIPENTANSLVISILMMTIYFAPAIYITIKKNELVSYISAVIAGVLLILSCLSKVANIHENEPILGLILNIPFMAYCSYVIAIYSDEKISWIYIFVNFFLMNTFVILCGYSRSSWYLICIFLATGSSISIIVRKSFLRDELLANPPQFLQLATVAVGGGAYRFGEIQSRHFMIDQLNFRQKIEYWIYCRLTQDNK